MVPALYLADHRQTATAEWYRSLAERGFSPADYLPYDHHRWHVALQLADLSDEERLTAVGLCLPRPSRHTWPAFQRVGEQLWREGWDGSGYSSPPGPARPGMPGLRAQVLALCRKAGFTPDAVQDEVCLVQTMVSRSHREPRRPRARIGQGPRASGIGHRASGIGHRGSTTGP